MLRPAIPWLVPVWVFGVALLSLRNLGGWVAIQRLKVLSTSAVDQEIHDMADRLRCRLKLRRAVKLLASAKAVSPMVVGVFKPVILVPASVLCGLSAAQLESILAHESAHVRRHDYLVNLLQSVIETLLFYHPAVWWIARQIRIERENCCDDVVVSFTRNRVAYVRALALVAGRRRPWRPRPPQGRWFPAFVESSVFPIEMPSVHPAGCRAHCSPRRLLASWSFGCTFQRPMPPRRNHCHRARCPERLSIPRAIPLPARR